MASPDKKAFLLRIDAVLWADIDSRDALTVMKERLPAGLEPSVVVVAAVALAAWRRPLPEPE